MNKVRHALIAGSGIAGPVVALALARAGIRSTLYESYAASADGIGAGLMVSPNGLEALKIVGVDAALRAVSQPIAHMAMADARGKVLTRFDGLEGMQPGRVVYRSDLYRVLRDAVVAAGIPIVHGKRLVSASEAADGVQVSFADGSHASGDILIGADGIRSTVRGLIDPGAPAPRYAGTLGFGALAPLDTLRIPSGTMTFVFGRHAFLGYWADPDRGICWFGNLPHATPASMEAIREIPSTQWLAQLRELYRDDYPAQTLLRHTAPAQLFAPIASELMPPVPRWHSGRMVLVGDAVHAPSSSSGQGASLAIESAIQLARCLRDIPTPSLAFARYEQLRRERVEAISAAAARTNTRKALGPLGKAIMHVVMPIALKTVFNPMKMLGSVHAYRIDWDAAAL
ncbi:monooxygenase [Burkholderia paludis]|uniref:FAD-dependent monooxygenase n=1 Tax=Burkholderia paludis TaxID=1506587 RepID=UPI0004DB529B|nr:FAD-dependent monooxygenase [Burkholderia paludis]KFG98194.1 monooxygenase [Burkholderia paludis]